MSVITCSGRLLAYGVHECARPAGSTAEVTKPKGDKVDVVPTTDEGVDYWLVRNNTTSRVNFELTITVP